MPSFVPVTNARNAQRTFVACAVGILAACAVHFRLVWPSNEASDWFQIWAGARLLIQGDNPYQMMGPHVGARVPWDFPYLYPLTAPVATLPFAMLPIRVAESAFMGISCGLLAFALTRDGWHRLAIFLSTPMLASISRVQWGPLLCAATLLPASAWLGVAFACKPNVALGLFAARPSRRMVYGGIALGVVSLAILPGWPLDWLQMVQGQAHYSPVTLGPGFLLPLALIRWRRADARMLAVNGVVRQNIVIYDMLPLMLLGRRPMETWLLVALSWVATRALPPLALNHPDAFAVWARDSATALIWWLYLPCLVLVLTRRNIANDSWSAFRTTEQAIPREPVAPLEIDNGKIAPARDDAR